MKCKVGDLAMVVKPNVPQNKGLLVEVERRTHGPRRGIYWWVRSVSGPAVRSDGTRDAHASIPDWALQPVRRPGTKRSPPLPGIATLQLDLGIG